MGFSRSTSDPCNLKLVQNCWANIPKLTQKMLVVSWWVHHFGPQIVGEVAHLRVAMMARKDWQQPWNWEPENRTVYIWLYIYTKVMYIFFILHAFKGDFRILFLSCPFFQEWFVSLDPTTSSRRVGSHGIFRGGMAAAQTPRRPCRGGEVCQKKPTFNGKRKIIFKYIPWDGDMLVPCCMHLLLFFSGGGWVRGVRGVRDRVDKSQNCEEKTTTWPLGCVFQPQRKMYSLSLIWEVSKPKWSFGVLPFWITSMCLFMLAWLQIYVYIYIYGYMYLKDNDILFLHLKNASKFDRWCIARYIVNTVDGRFHLQKLACLNTLIIYTHEKNIFFIISLKLKSMWKKTMYCNGFFEYHRS